MISFSLFSFSYPQNLRDSLLNTPAITTDEKSNLLKSKCKEIPLAKGTEQISQIKKLILNSKADNYLVLYCNCPNDFVFSSNEKITETLLYKKEKVIFRIFSKRGLQISEIMFYLIYKELDINEIKPYGRPH